MLLSLQGAEHNKVVPHYALEQWLRASGLGWTFVRASFFMQNLTTTHLTDIRDRDEIMVRLAGVPPPLWTLRTLRRSPSGRC